MNNNNKKAGLGLKYGLSDCWAQFDLENHMMPWVILSIGLEALVYHGWDPEDDLSPPEYPG